MANLSRETILNIAVTLVMLVLPFVATAIDEPFYITLATRLPFWASQALG